MSTFINPVTVMPGTLVTSAAMHAKAKSDLQDMIDAYLEMHAFTREVLEVALARGDSLGYDSDEDLVERWEQLTGEVYGEDYCTE